MGWFWVDSGGGPLVAVPMSRLAQWSGTAVPAERSVNAAFRWDGASDASDYDLACDVSDWVEVVGWLDVTVLVLGDEPMNTAWLPRPDGGLLVRWYAAESEAHVEALVATLSDPRGWDDEGARTWSVDGPVVLFDSAYPGIAVDETRHARLEIASGEYRVATCHPEDPDTVTSLVVHALVRE